MNRLSQNLDDLRLSLNQLIGPHLDYRVREAMANASTLIATAAHIQGNVESGATPLILHSPHAPKRHD